MKIRKRITIVADILVDEDFDINNLVIAQLEECPQHREDNFLGCSENFEVLDYIEQDIVELGECEEIKE